MTRDDEDAYDKPFRNPLDDLIEFPEGVVTHRQNILPSESQGWGIHMLLGLPRSVVQASLDTQLTMAGFRSETGSEAMPGLLRFIRSDAYVWGMVSDGPDRTTSVLVSYTPGGDHEQKAE